MGKVYKKYFKEIVNVWVEMMHLELELLGLDDYTYDIYELYELDGNYDITEENDEGEEISIIQLYSNIVTSGEIASRLVENSKAILKNQVLQILEQGESKKFFGEEIANINSKNIDGLFEYAYEVFSDSIYAYNSEEQYSNFIKYLIEQDKLIGEEDDVS